MYKWAYTLCVYMISFMECVGFGEGGLVLGVGTNICVLWGAVIVVCV